MKTFSLFYLGACIAFADALFPYTAIALAGWLAVAVGILVIQKLFSE